MITIILLLMLLLESSYLMYSHLAQKTKAHLWEPNTSDKPVSTKNGTVTVRSIETVSKEYFDLVLERYLKNNYPQMSGYRLTSGDRNTLQLGVEVFFNDKASVRTIIYSSTIFKAKSFCTEDWKKLVNDVRKKIDEEKAKFYMEHLTNVLALIEKETSPSFDYSVEDFTEEDKSKFLEMLFEAGYEVYDKGKFIRICCPISA